MVAVILDLAAARRARGLPAPRPTAREAEPPPGLRIGDRVRCLASGETGTVIGWRIERLLDGDGAARPCFMLGVSFPAMRRVLPASEVAAAASWRERPEEG